MEMLGSTCIQGKQLGIFMLESKSIDGFELFIIEACVVAILEASLLFHILTVTFSCGTTR
jgi:hypothetical protein